MVWFIILIVTEAFLSLPLKLPIQEKMALYLSNIFSSSSSRTLPAFWKHTLFQLQQLTDLTTIFPTNLEGY